MIEHLENDLRKALSECEALLREVRVFYWSNEISDILGKWIGFTHDDYKKILSWYGGMGNFDDLIICVGNGHKISPEDEKNSNIKLRELQLAIYNLTKSLLLHQKH